MNDTADKMFDYLVERYPDGVIEKLENGGYFVTTTKMKNGIRGNQDQIYIPAEFNSDNVSVISYFPGSGGNSGIDANKLREKISSDNPPNNIITIAGTFDDPGNTMEEAADICADNGLTVSNLTLGTFSASGGSGFKQLESYLEKHPETEASMIIADGYNLEKPVFYNGNPSQYFKNVDTLIEKKVPIVLINPYNSSRLDYSTATLGKMGFNAYILETENTGHMAINYDMLNNGLLEYSNGLTDELGGEEDTLSKCNYTLKMYDPDNPQADRNGYVVVDSFEGIRQENSSFGYNLSKLESNPFEEGTIASDMYLTVSSINSIRNSMGVSDIQDPVYSSTSTIPENLIKAQSSLFGISSNLSNNLNNETQIIASIAQVFYDMDRERSNAANELNSSFNEAAYSDAINQLINYDFSSSFSLQEFMFDPGNHVEGNTGKLYLSDLTSMVSGSSLTGVLHDNFESERESAKNTKKEIDNLIQLMETSSNFQGESWAKVKEKLNTYSDLMSIRIYSVGLLEHAMAKALNLLINYMEEYEELDDTKINELREQIKKLKTDITEAQNIINATHVVKEEYEVLGTTQCRYKTEYVHSLETRMEAKQTLALSTQMVEEIMKKVAKLEGMSIVIAQAEQIINDALSEIYSKYATRVSDIVTGKEASYEPPANTSYVASTYPVAEEFNINELSDVDIKNIWTTGHISEKMFNNIPGLKDKWGTYEDYLNNVEAKNNPEYNSEYNNQKNDNEIKLEDENLNTDTPSNTDTPEDKPSNNDTPEDTPGNTGTPEDTPGNTDTPEDKPGNNDTPQETPGNTGAPEDTPSNNDAPEDTPDNTGVPEDTPGNTGVPEDTPGNTVAPEDTPSINDAPEDTPGNTDTPQDKPNNVDTPVQEKPNISESNKGNSSNSESVVNTPSENVSGSETVSGEENINTGDITEELPNEDTQTETVPPIIDIPDDVEEIVDITPPDVKDTIDSSSETSELAKKIGVGIGVAAAVGAATLGAHTYVKAKKNDIYED